MTGRIGEHTKMSGSALISSASLPASKNALILLLGTAMEYLILASTTLTPRILACTRSLGPSSLIAGYERQDSMPRSFSLRKEEAGEILQFSKGIAILLIMFEHFSRSVWFSHGGAPPATLQWNFDPAGEGLGVLASTAGAGRYAEAFLRLLAQFGYVGVHLFVLMSGLGLALGTEDKIAFVPFLRRRFFKVLPPFWTAVAYFAVLGNLIGQPYSAIQVALRLSLLTTFDQRQFFVIDSPMWCLAVFFQLYLLFLPLRWLITRFGPRILLLLAAIGFIARSLMDSAPVQHWNLFFGHVFGLNWLAVFGLGIWIGGKLRQDGEIALPARTVTVTALAAILLLVLSEAFRTVYPAHDTAIGVLIGAAALLAWSLFRKTRPGHALSELGAISFPLYLYHRPIVGIVVAYANAHPVVGYMPPLSLGFITVPALILTTLLIGRLLAPNPRFAAMAFGV
jgi:peptidoglycan/LPS O-acetylase OafA/YrhL